MAEDFNVLPPLTNFCSLAVYPLILAAFSGVVLEFANASSVFFGSVAAATGVEVATGVGAVFCSTVPTLRAASLG